MTSSINCLSMTAHFSLYVSLAVLSSSLAVIVCSTAQTSEEIRADREFIEAKYSWILFAGPMLAVGTNQPFPSSCGVVTGHFPQLPQIQLTALLGLNNYIFF